MITIFEIVALLALGYQLPRYLNIELTDAGHQALSDTRSAIPGAIQRFRDLGAVVRSAGWLGLADRVASPLVPQVSIDFTATSPAGGPAAAKEIQRAISKRIVSPSAKV
jgi:hypothetical protein